MHYNISLKNEDEKSKLTQLQQNFELIKKKQTTHKPKLLVHSSKYFCAKFIDKNLDIKYNIATSVDNCSTYERTISSLPDILLFFCPNVIKDVALCSKIKKNILTSHIPILVIGDIHSKEERIKFLESGADVYILKTDCPSLLNAQIKSLVENRRILKSYFYKELPFLNTIAKNSEEQLFIKRIEKIFESNYSKYDFCISELVTQMGISRTQLHMKTKLLTGMSAGDYIRTLRLKKGAELLKQGQLNISEVSYQVGLKDPKHFSKQFKNYFGVTPSLFKKGDFTQYLI